VKHRTQVLICPDIRQDTVCVRTADILLEQTFNPNVFQNWLPVVKGPAGWVEGARLPADYGVLTGLGQNKVAKPLAAVHIVSSN
jgi:hypothetical protein